MSNLAELKSAMEDALVAYAAALQRDNGDDSPALITGWVVVVEVMSERGEINDEWALGIYRPEAQRVPYTIGLLHGAEMDFSRRSLE